MKTPSFVKKFDIRGKYGVDIQDKDAFYVTLALIKTFSPKRVLVGWDTRPISYSLASNAMAAFLSKEVIVSYLPECPIEYITTGANACPYDLSIMFTGSHNPFDWTGLLIHLPGGDSLRDEKMEQVFENYESCLHEPLLSPFHQLDILQNAITEIEAIYTHRLMHLVPLSDIPQIEIAVDIGDGSGYRGLDIFESILPQVTVHRLNDRRVYDSLSSHIADPAIPETMQQLREYLALHPSIQYGFAFDSDADRVLAIDRMGRYCDGSELGSIIAQSERFLRHHRLLRVGYAVECGPAIQNTFLTIKDTAVRLTAVPVGRSIHRGLLRNGSENFCLENAGHFYFQEFFQTDSSIYSMMLILLTLSLRLKHEVLFLQDGYRLEIDIPASKEFTHVSEDLVKELEGLLSNMKLIYVDGVRGEIYDTLGMIKSWFAIRHSGYEDKFKCYFGALSSDDFYTIKQVFEQYLV